MFSGISGAKWRCNVPANIKTDPSQSFAEASGAFLSVPGGSLPVMLEIRRFWKTDEGDNKRLTAAHFSDWGFSL
jgi:hypothetical protein